MYNKQGVQSRGGTVISLNNRKFRHFTSYNMENIRTQKEFTPFNIKCFSPNHAPNPSFSSSNLVETPKCHNIKSISPQQRNSRKGLPELFSPQRILDPTRYQAIENLLKFKLTRKRAKPREFKSHSPIKRIKLKKSSKKKITRLKDKLNTTKLIPFQQNPNYLEDPSGRFQVKISRASKRFDTCPFLNYTMDSTKIDNISPVIEHKKDDLKMKVCDTSSVSSTDENVSKEVKIPLKDFLNVSSAYNAKESKSPTSPINVIGKNNQLNVFCRSVSKRISLITSKTITPHCFKGLSSPTTEDRKKKFNEFGNFSLVNI